MNDTNKELYSKKWHNNFEALREFLKKGTKSILKKNYYNNKRIKQAKTINGYNIDLVDEIFRLSPIINDFKRLGILDIENTNEFTVFIEEEEQQLIDRIMKEENEKRTKFENLKKLVEGTISGEVTQDTFDNYFKPNLSEKEDYNSKDILRIIQENQERTKLENFKTRIEDAISGTVTQGTFDNYFKPNLSDVVDIIKDILEKEDYNSTDLVRTIQENQERTKLENFKTLLESIISDKVTQDTLSYFKLLLSDIAYIIKVILEKKDYNSTAIVRTIQRNQKRTLKKLVEDTISGTVTQDTLNDFNPNLSDVVDIIKFILESKKDIINHIKEKQETREYASTATTEVNDIQERKDRIKYFFDSLKPLLSKFTGNIPVILIIYEKIFYISFAAKAQNLISDLDRYIKNAETIPDDEECKSCLLYSLKKDKQKVETQLEFLEEAKNSPSLLPKYLSRIDNTLLDNIQQYWSQHMNDTLNEYAIKAQAKEHITSTEYVEKVVASEGITNITKTEALNDLTKEIKTLLEKKNSDIDAWLEGKTQGNTNNSKLSDFIMSADTLAEEIIVINFDDNEDVLTSRHLNNLVAALHNQIQKTNEDSKNTKESERISNILNFFQEFLDALNVALKAQELDSDLSESIKHNKTQYRSLVESDPEDKEAIGYDIKTGIFSNLQKILKLEIAIACNQDKTNNLNDATNNNIDKETIKGFNEALNYVNNYIDKTDEAIRDVKIQDLIHQNYKELRKVATEVEIKLRKVEERYPFTIQKISENYPNPTSEFTTNANNHPTDILDSPELHRIIQRITARNVTLHSKSTPGNTITLDLLTFNEIMDIVVDAKSKKCLSESAQVADDEAVRFVSHNTTHNTNVGTACKSAESVEVNTMLEPDLSEFEGIIDANTERSFLHNTNVETYGESAESVDRTIQQKSNDAKASQVAATTYLTILPPPNQRAVRGTMLHSLEEEKEKEQAKTTVKSISPAQVAKFTEKHIEAMQNQQSNTQRENQEYYNYIAENQHSTPKDLFFSETPSETQTAAIKNIDPKIKELEYIITDRILRLNIKPSDLHKDEARNRIYEGIYNVIYNFLFKNTKLDNRHGTEIAHSYATGITASLKEVYIIKDPDILKDIVIVKIKAISQEIIRKLKTPPLQEPENTNQATSSGYNYKRNHASSGFGEEINNPVKIFTATSYKKQTAVTKNSAFTKEERARTIANNIVSLGIQESDLYKDDVIIQIYNLIRAIMLPFIINSLTNRYSCEILKSVIEGKITNNVDKLNKTINEAIGKIQKDVNHEINGLSKKKKYSIERHLKSAGFSEKVIKHVMSLEIKDVCHTPLLEPENTNQATSSYYNYNRNHASTGFVEEINNTVKIFSETPSKKQIVITENSAQTKEELSDQQIKERTDIITQTILYLGIQPPISDEDEEKIYKYIFRNTIYLRENEGIVDLRENEEIAHSYAKGITASLKEVYTIEDPVIIRDIVHEIIQKVHKKIILKPYTPLQGPENTNQATSSGYNYNRNHASSGFGEEINNYAKSLEDQPDDTGETLDYNTQQQQEAKLTKSCSQIEIDKTEEKTSFNQQENQPISTNVMQPSASREHQPNEQPGPSHIGY